MEYVKSETKHVKTAYSALTVSVISIISAILNVVYLPFILSSIAIIISHISKGRLKTRPVPAQAATVIAILAIILHIAFLGFYIYQIQNNPVYINAMDQITREMNGMTFEEYYNSIMESMNVSIPQNN